MKTNLYRRQNPDYIGRMCVADFLEQIEAEEENRAFPHEAVFTSEIPHGVLAGRRAFDRETIQRKKLGRGKKIGSIRYKLCRVVEHVECVSEWGELPFHYPSCGAQQAGGG